MKKILLFVFLIFYQWSFGQLEFKNSNVGRVMEFADLSGHSLLKKYDPDITGSPFFNDDWILARVTLSRGKQIGPLPIKLNLESNELYFLDSSGKELIALEGLVRKVDCVNYFSKDSIRYIFKSGYPSIDKQNDNYYYQVFTEGNIELLAKKFKYVTTEKNDLTGETSKEFVDGGAVLYVYAYGIMQTLRPTKSFITSLLEEDKQQAINRYISANKINFKKVPDLIKLFNYYDSIQK